MGLVGEADLLGNAGSGAGVQRTTVLSALPGRTGWDREWRFWWTR